LQKIEAQIETVGPMSEANQMSSRAPTASTSTAKHAKKKSSAGKPTGSKPREGKKQTLREALTQVLSKSTRPLSTQELADRAVQNGYQTKSKDLKNVIWVGIGHMNNIERVPGIGYRLKKGKS